MDYQTLRVRLDESVCFLKLDRPQANNAIDRTMVDECRDALKACTNAAHVVVLEGAPEVFCSGADFQTYSEGRQHDAADPEALYDLWSELARGPFVSIAHVRGKVQAGGVGFVAACDVVLADLSAEFSLSELLFGLFPACVLPFLVRRIGFQKAHYMTLTTQPVAVQQALDWGLVDACGSNSEDLLRRQLLRLRRLTPTGIRRYKAYADSLDPILERSRSAAIAANRELFSDPETLETITRFVRTGLFPWQR